MSPPTSLSLRQEALLRANRAQQLAGNSYSSDDDDDVCVPPAFALRGNHSRNIDSNNSIATYQQHSYGYASTTPRVSNTNNNVPTAASIAHPMAASEPALLYHHQQLPGNINYYDNNTHASPALVATTAATGSNSTDTSHDLVQSARQEWRQYGHGVTQILEEKRRAGPLQVRVTAAQERTDVSGGKYTTYVIQLVDNNKQTGSMTMEHRYSEFNKLHALLQQHSIRVDATFPHKHWAGRVGNWTPSLQWAPERHAALVQYRTQQLDMWLVHVVERYNQHSLPQVAMNAVYEFLLVPPKLPCDRVNPITVTAVDGISQIATTPKWQWNNPFSTTLGSAIRQATCTVQYMCCSSNSKTNMMNNHTNFHQKPAVLDADQSIPLDLLQAAHGLCFMTVFKAGLVVSGRFGTGLVIARLPSSSATNPNTTSGVHWSAPVAVATAGMGWGAQVGGDVTHYLIVLTNPKAVQDLVSSSSVTLGAELGVAVGPVGRGANSHVQTGDWTLHSAYSYAHSQGLFVGISLEGSVVRVRDDVNAKFYGQACNAPDLLRQAGPTAAQSLYAALEQALRTEIKEGAFRPSEMFSPKRNSEVSAAQSWKNRLVPPSPNGVVVPSNAYSVNAAPADCPITMGSMYNGQTSLADAATPSPSMPRQR